MDSCARAKRSRVREEGRCSFRLGARTSGTEAPLQRTDDGVICRTDGL